MKALFLPDWLRKLQQKYSNYQIMSEKDLLELKNKLNKLNAHNPLVSIVIPAWNEEDTILLTIASLAYNEFDFPCELLVVNNNSTDNTQFVLEKTGVRFVNEYNQGIAPARRRGLIESKGKYHLCCDSDTIYPQKWIKTMVEALINNENKQVACVYSTYSFLPSANKSRFVLGLYEIARDVFNIFKSKKTETLRIMGFNFGFIRNVALKINGFVIDKPRKFRNILGSIDYVDMSEDGLLALNIKKAGYKIQYINKKNSIVWTSDRRINIDGGLVKAIKLRLLKSLNRKKFDTTFHLNK